MIRAVLKVLLAVLWTLLWFLPVWLVKLAKKYAWRDRLIQHYCAGILRIVGIRLTVRGQLSSARPLLLVSNHLTYMDVPILASQAALRFTPKQEIAKWPVIGFFCSLTGAVYVDRRPEKVKLMKDRIHEVLKRGEVISLFPESTTGNGIYVLPFRSGFFNMAEEGIDGRELTIQPAAMTYTHVRRLPVDSTQWPDLAWYGDMDIFPHLWKFLMLGPIDVELRFLEPVTISQYKDRKALAAACQQAISQAIEDIRIGE